MSTETKWTPGPWSVSTWISQPNNRAKPMVAASGITVAVTHPAPVCGYEECEANARLIAAAPELYQELVSTTASLSAAISLLERGGSRAAASDKMFCVMLEDYRRQVDLSRAALRKARGETE